MPTSSRAKFAAARIGLAGPVQATPFSFPHHLKSWRRSWRTSRNIFIKQRSAAARSHWAGACSVRDRPPYLDGNGRIGRLLITLLLEHWKLLSAPLLYLSLFFKRHRAEYYRLLGEVRRSGDWEAWIEFFLEGVATIADEAVIAAREVVALVSEDRQRLISAPGASIMAIRLMDRLPIHPVVTIPDSSQITQDNEADRRQGRRALGEFGRAHRDHWQTARPHFRIR